MDNVLSFGTEGFVEDGRNEEGAKILGILERAIPVLFVRANGERNIAV